MHQIENFGQSPDENAPASGQVTYPVFRASFADGTQGFSLGRKCGECSRCKTIATPFFCMKNANVIYFQFSSTLLLGVDSVG